ncbi:MAG: HAD family hydrolase [Phycisphaerae bacterium]
MKYDAVIFDLFGTLVPTPREEEFNATHTRIAELLGITVERFLGVWRDDEFVTRRDIGLLPDSRSALQAACEELGIQPDPAAIDAAVRERLNMFRRFMQPRPDSADTLDVLGAAGLKRGLMSDCPPETPQVWPETKLAERIDAALFSPTVGMRKPERRFYELACERLDVNPGRCLFVGDGGSPELSGATEMGMDAVLICPPKEAHIINNRNETRNWTGKRIERISEVLPLAGLERVEPENH